MKQKIRLIYESEYENAFSGHCGTPRRIEHELTGEINLTELLENFDCFVKALGYVPPDNSTLDYVKEEQPC